MALPLLADLTDFETWETTPVGNVARAEAILAAASTLIRAETGRVWVDADGNLEDDLTEVHRETVRSVCLTVTSRVYNNPHGQTQETVANYSSSVAAWSAQGLALTDDERSQLATPRSFGGLATISTTRGDLETRAVLTCWEDTDDMPDFG